jgi:hypothetical protein
MKSFRDYLKEFEEIADRPINGDEFAINCREECLIETWICDVREDGIVLHADDRMMYLLDGYGLLSEDVDQETISELSEAEYQGRKVSLGKPTRGDVKKFKVYVKNPQGNVVKVNFGDPDMKIKKSNPARRRSFRARHRCDNPGPRHKARYWSCRAW